MGFSELSEFLDSLISTGTPGYDCAIYRGGREIYRRRGGYSDPTNERPVTADTIFRLYSLTKPLTVTTALQCMERGLFGLSDPVDRYLPEFSDMRVKYLEDGRMVTRPAERKIKVIDLFTMCAGLDYGTGSAAMRRMYEEKPEYTSRDFVETLAGQPLVYQPGSRWNYSFCHDVLAALIERAADKPFGELMKEGILDPLGMKDTFFHAPVEKLERMARRCRYDPDTDSYTRLPEENEYQRSPRFESGGAGLFSTVDDYVKFGSALANGGTSPDGIRILKRETLNLALRDHLTPAQHEGYNWPRLRGYGYGLGFWTLIDDSDTSAPLAEFGWGGAMGCYFTASVEKNVCAVFAQQVLPARAEEIRLHMRNLIYSSI